MRSTNTPSLLVVKQRSGLAARVLPNPSIERTVNGGRLLLAPSSPLAPLSAAHVKR